jgi:hypothetical protein
MSAEAPQRGERMVKPRLKGGWWWNCMDNSPFKKRLDLINQGIDHDLEKMALTGRLRPANMNMAITIL